MKAVHTTVEIPTRGKGTYEITAHVRRAVAGSGVTTGTATVFIRHTSASLVIYENADPSAREDLHAWFERLVDEDDTSFVHTLEGPDDTTSHLRMALTRTSEVIPIAHSALTLGTWQGVFLFEHRRSPHRRTVDIVVMGV